MPRKPDTPEQIAMKLAQSYKQEETWLEEAFTSPTGIFLEFRTHGEALNRAQRINKCRTFLRQQAQIESKLETYNDIIVRKEGNFVYLTKSAPVRKGMLQETTALVPGATIQAAPVPTAEELLKQLKVLVEMKGAIPGEKIDLWLVDQFKGDSGLLLETITELVTQGKAKWTDWGALTTEMEEA